MYICMCVCVCACVCVLVHAHACVYVATAPHEQDVTQETSKSFEFRVFLLQDWLPY